MTEESNELPDQHRISEQNAHRLLARAAEIDAHSGGHLSVAQLREIALEAGIEGAAFDEALREFAARDYSESIDRRAVGGARVVRRGARVVEWLGRHRALSVLAIMLGASFATPGDLVFQMLAISAPTYVAYELCLMVARKRNRPTDAPPTPPSSRKPDADTRRSDNDSINLMVRALLLRHA